MHFEFSSTAKAARSSLAVPALSLESVRGRARAIDGRERIRAFALSATLVLAAVSVGSGFAARLIEGVHGWLSGNTASIIVTSLVVVQHPMPADIKAAAERATFPVVFPVGLPEGTRVIRLLYAPREHPNSITILYQNDRTNLRAGFTLSETSALNTNGAAPRPGSALVTEVTHWEVGGETVLVPKKSIAPETVSDVKRAMLSASAPQSLAATQAIASRIDVMLGNSERAAELAEHVAPADGSTVLIDAKTLRLIPRLLKTGKPLVDTRIAFLTDIPSVNGAPQYTKATIRWPRVPVASGTGIRAIDAVLRIAGTPKVGLIFHRHDPRAFWIWTMNSETASPTKYVVDANTLAVNRQP